MTATPRSETTQHLARLAQKLRTDRAYMASILAAYQTQEKLDEIELADRLSMDVAQVPQLALCKRPFSESNEFAKQVRQIASYTGADQTVLAQIIRQVVALEQFDALPDMVAPKAEKRPLASSSGFLAAARDREDSANKSASDDMSEDNSDASS